MGTGRILGPVTVQSTAIFSPGASIGTLAISNNLTMSSGSTNVFEVNLDTLEHDLVAGVKNVTYGGTLVVNNVGGTAAATNGATMQLLIAGSYGGSFAAVNLPELGPGLAWDMTGQTNGSLKIVATVSMVPTNITFSVTGSTLSLGWPADHLGWYAQSNSVGVASPGFWYDVADSQLGTNLNITIDPAQPNVFFRLRSP